MPTRGATVLLTGLLAVSCALAAGCGGGRNDPHAAHHGASAGAGGTWPLTGLPVAHGSTSVLARPVLVVKLDDTPSSAPQRGLSKADLVVEELVEGGITRLAAFYDTHLPAVVGPVRSMRASDVGIVTPVGATLVTSGAAPPTLARLRQAGVPFLTEGAPGFYRDPSRYAPYNLFARLPDVARAATAARAPAVRPPDYLSWGTDADLPALPTAPAARHVAVTFSATRTSEWRYRGGADGHYRNTDSFAAAGDGFAADNLLVLRVRIGDAGYLDPAGNHVPETDLTGGGEAMLFRHGHVIRGAWHKDALSAPLALLYQGAAMRVPAGRTFVELVPTATGSVTYGR